MNEYVKKSLKIGGLLCLCGALFASGLIGGYYLGKTNNNQPTKQLKNDTRKMVVSSEEISDLNGSTWFLGLYPTASYLIKDINFSSNSLSFSGIKWETSGMQVDGYYLNSSTNQYTQVYSHYENMGGGRVKNRITAGGWMNDAYRTIVISGGDDVQDNELISWLYQWATLEEYNPPVESDSESDSVTESTTEILTLNNYDYRGWFGNVDSYTGLIEYELNQATYLTYGGVEWVNTGNNRKYNCIGIIIQPIYNANEVFAISKDPVSNNGETYYNGRSAEELYGSDWNKFSYITSIYYCYKEGYTGGELAAADAEYRDIVYKMPLVSCKNSGGSSVAGWLSGNYQIQNLYNSMEILEDNNTKFNTPRYNDVSIMELWKTSTNNYSVFTISASTGSVFSLLGSAFTAVASLMTIQVFPGISLGLLFFLPLIAGILIAIIWIVKR